MVLIVEYLKLWNCCPIEDNKALMTALYLLSVLTAFSNQHFALWFADLAGG